MASPITDLAGLTLEVNHLERALTFYQPLFGLPLLARSDAHGTVTLRAGPHQTLTLWKPLTRRPMAPWLDPLGPAKRPMRRQRSHSASSTRARRTPTSSATLRK